MSRMRVGVVFGGRSGEHEVSLLSAASVMAALDRRQYDVIPIGIDKLGRWRRGTAAQSQDPAAVLRTGRPFVLPPVPVHLLPRRGEGLVNPQLDVILPILHGTFGEDGTVQGLLELSGIPYVGAGVLGSAASMDKDVMKRLFREAGLPVVPFMVVRRRAWEATPATVLRHITTALPFPLFVKPANLGSSVGISKVSRRRELTPALIEAARYDEKLVIEQGVDAREFECSVLGNDEPQASVPGEVRPGKEFYSYAAKYLEPGSSTIVPAPMPPALARQVQRLALRAFRAVDACGLARVDFFYVPRTRQLFLNEINTMPGFTSISMFPKMWEASGLSYPKLLDRMIALALERARSRARNHYGRD